MNNKTFLQYHLIFVTKYRKKILDDRISAKIKTIIEELCVKNRWELITIEVGESDHIHIMLKLAPKFSISKVVQILKQMTRYYVWQDFPSLRKHYWKKDLLWSSGYFCSTTGEASAETIKKYIESQG